MIKAKVIAIPPTAFMDELKATAGRMRDHARTTKLGAKAVEKRLRSHFQALNSRPNKQGWSKSNFWGKIAGSMVVLSDGNAGVVQVNDPALNLKVFGGTVTPKTSKLLAIPLQAEFAGKRPGEFPKDRFFFLPTKVGGSSIGILAEALGDNKLRAAYLLNKYTKHAPQPDALPPMDELRSVAVEAMKKAILRG